jgi:hypothetical protein
MNEKQESVTLRKPRGGYRNPRENRKSTTKSLPPLAGGSNPGENGKSTTKSRSPLQAGRRIKEPMGKRKVNNK